MDRVKGKVCIVTGAALGIGRACALRLAEEGARIALFDVLDEEGEALATELRGRGAEAGYWHVDVASEASVASAIDAVVARFGGADVLVNNAGIAGANKPTHELTVEEWDRVQAVNVKGVFLGTKHVIPYMRRGGRGSIVNLSSIYGLVGAPDVPPYHASKGAVRLMTKTDALLYAADAIRVNSIHPGYIRTTDGRTPPARQRCDRPRDRAGGSRTPASAWPPRRTGRHRLGRRLPRLRRVEVHDGQRSGDRRRLHGALNRNMRGLARRRPA
jgi:NAD(P)-dependent dehydrogenase (short-subunit alcohol dehydrogenase family)